MLLTYLVENKTIKILNPPTKVGNFFGKIHIVFQVQKSACFSPKRTEFDFFFFSTYEKRKIVEFFSLVFQILLVALSLFLFMSIRGGEWNCAPCPQASGMQIVVVVVVVVVHTPRSFCTINAIVSYIVVS